MKNKIALITGASSGIGKACAEKLAALGCKLILAARRMDRLVALSDRLKQQHGTKCVLLELDVRKPEEVASALDNLPEDFRAIDILINNAGLARGVDPIQSGKPQDWDEMIDTNIKGLLYVSRAVLPGMLQRNRGHVINIGSIAGLEVYSGGAVYCATKHAVRAISQGMRLDMVGSAVRVSLIAPGMVETDFSLVRFHGDANRAEQVYNKFPPLTPGDISDAIVYALEAPPNVDVSEMLIMPTESASATVNSWTARKG